MRDCAIMVSDPPIVELPPAHPEKHHVGDVLQQRVAAQAHKGKHAQRQQGYGHNYHLGCHRQVEPHQLRIADYDQQQAGLYRVTGLQHPAQQLARVGIVGWYRVNVAVFSFFSHY